MNWKTERKFDITIAIGFWDYIQDPPERLRLIRNFTGETFLSAWPRFWTWRMPVRKVRLQYIRGCPVYFFRKPQVFRMLESAGFRGGELRNASASYSAWKPGRSRRDHWLAGGSACPTQNAACQPILAFGSS